MEFCLNSKKIHIISSASDKFNFGVDFWSDLCDFSLVEQSYQNQEML